MRIFHIVPILFAAILLTGCASNGEEAAGGFIELRLARDDPAQGYIGVPLPGGSERVYISQIVEMTERDIKSAELLRTRRGVAVGVTFTRSGARKLERLTEQHLHERLAILMDGKLIVAPAINAPIRDGKMILIGHQIEQQAAALVRRINDRLRR